MNAGQVAISNFNECLSEIWECYEETADSEPNWTTSRIKTYCAQVANVPHCYEEMICHPSGAQFTAVINLQDNPNCIWSHDYTRNTCRNVVTLNEILYGAADDQMSLTDYSESNQDFDSAMLREGCLRQALGLGANGQCAANDPDCWNLRNWKKAPVSEK